MGKYLYIAHLKWSAKAAEKGAEAYAKEWFPKHDELAKKAGLKVIHQGTPFGVPEDAVWIYKGDTTPDAYAEFRVAVGRIEVNTLDWARTTIVSLNP